MLSCDLKSILTDTEGEVEEEVWRNRRRGERGGGGEEREMECHH